MTVNAHTSFLKQGMTNASFEFLSQDLGLRGKAPLPFEHSTLESMPASAVPHISHLDWICCKSRSWSTNGRGKEGETQEEKGRGKERKGEGELGLATSLSFPTGPINNIEHGNGNISGKI